MKLRKKIILSFGIGIISFSSIVASTIIATQNIGKQNQQKSSNQKNVLIKNSINSNLSTKWVNDNKNTNYVQKSFNSILYYDNNSYKKSSFLVLTKKALDINSSGTDKKFNLEMRKDSRILNTLNISQQNRIKNAMLLMYLASKNKKLNYSTLSNVLQKITNSKNVEYVQNELKNINLKKENSSYQTNFFSYAINFQNTVSTGEIIYRLNIATDIFVTLSAVAAAFSALMFGLAWITGGGTLPWAGGAAIVSVASGVIAGSLTIGDMTTLQADANKLSTGYATTYTTFLTIYNLVNFIPQIISGLEAFSATATPFMWVMPTIATAIGVFSLVITFLQQFNIIN